MAASLASGKLTSALQSVSSQITSVITTGKLSKSNDAKFFASGKRGEVIDLRGQLNAAQGDKKKAAVKKVIAAMTMGKDVSSLFPDMVNCMQTTNLELKKLVYLYVIHFARSKPELAVLAVNTFRKDTLDVNPLVRALSLRTMGCIRLPQMVEYIVEPLQRLCRDPDPYVRKTAAICVAKLHDTDPNAVESNGFIQVLRDMRSDTSPLVVANAIGALDGISRTSDVDELKLTSDIVHKLILSLAECSEWGQTIILDAISNYYTPSSNEERSLMAERLTSRLNHANPGVVLSCTRLLLKVMPESDNLLSRRILPPLISLLSTDGPEIQFIILRNLCLLCQRYPGLLTSGETCRNFFVKFSDPLYVKFEKLELLVLCAGRCNAILDLILEELFEYSSDVEMEFVVRAIRAIGRISVTVAAAKEQCVNHICGMFGERTGIVLDELVLAARDLLRYYYRDPYTEKMIVEGIRKIRGYSDLTSTDARVAYIFVAGELAEKLSKPNNGLPVIEKLISIPDPDLSVRHQILYTSARFLVRMKTGSVVIIGLIQPIANDRNEHPDLRDRANLYIKLLKPENPSYKRKQSDDTEALGLCFSNTECAMTALTINVLGIPPPNVDLALSYPDPSLLQYLINHLGLLATIYQSNAKFFVPKLKPNTIYDLPQTQPLQDSLNEEEEQKHLSCKPSRSKPLNLFDESSNSSRVSEEDDECLGKIADSEDTGENSPAEDSENNDRQLFSEKPPPADLWFVSQGNFMIEGCLTRRNGFASLLVKISNLSLFENLDVIKFSIRPNSFGLEEDQNIEDMPVNIIPGSFGRMEVRLQPKGNNSNQPPSDPPTLQADVTLSQGGAQPPSTATINIGYDILNVFIERPAVDKNTFKEHWNRMGVDVKQCRFMGKNADETTCFEANEVIRALSRYNLATVAQSDAATYVSIYFSGVTTNNLLFLIEASLQKTGPGIRIAMRTDTPILVGSLSSRICL